MTHGKVHRCFSSSRPSDTSHRSYQSNRGLYDSQRGYVEAENAEEGQGGESAEHTTREYLTAYTKGGNRSRLLEARGRWPVLIIRGPAVIQLFVCRRRIAARATCIGCRPETTVVQSRLQHGDRAYSERVGQDAETIRLHPLANARCCRTLSK